MSTALTVKVQAIDALLPQTQCERCGYPGCLPYASTNARPAARP
jgi:electron transport complex protein RnfB